MPRPPNEGLLTEKLVRDGLAVEAPGHTPGRVMSLQRLFISGHSLVDQPLPDQLAGIGAALKRPLHWQRHCIPGSSIRDRSGLQIPEGHYDASIITERHDLIGSLVWNDTVGELRSWQDRMISISPGAVTFFYMPWLSIDNKHDPRRWIAYERAAAHVWQCMVTRVNIDIAQQGRIDRIVTIPASLALAHLVEQLLQGQRAPGYEGASPREALDSLVSDDVHLTPLGSNYIAMVSYLCMTGESAVRLRESGQPRFYVDMAAQFLGERAGTGLAMTPDSGHRYIRESFHEDYWDYAKRSNLRAGRNALQAWWSARRMRRATSALTQVLFR